MSILLGGFDPPIDDLDAAVVALAELYRAEADPAIKPEKPAAIELGRPSAPAPHFWPFDQV